ncbi:ABC transporter ATP-binding protein [Schaalia sp. lx-260]|uniref:ABC transporter ATP-binding protein n=1 Tax=Schaalia sp. lx-260 TaxID=2899082 RepID=UPI001E3159AA|nr:ATP-binding cassette domain-containing protein [Schaalia sp. lx-260]MCD4550210.1 ATP-binding cassette domain-containing protein [Schaalia sp. lx-260]
MQTLLDVRDVTLTYAGKTILDSVTWQTHAGEHWVILGPNGAGKTSLVRTVTGREIPQAGQVTACGMDCATTEHALLSASLGFSSQTVAQRIRPTVSTRDVVRTAAWGLHESWKNTYEECDNERADLLLNAFVISHVADQPFGTLSEGERQRCLLARSLMTDPEVLILDEPGAGLDLGGREILVNALTEIIEGEHAPQILMITHQVEEIPAAMTHALVMAEGKILAAGPIGDVLNGVTLSHAYSLPLSVGCTEGRWWARALPQIL